MGGGYARSRGGVPEIGAVCDTRAQLLAHPTVHYRPHANNTLGWRARDSWSSRFHQLRHILNERHQKWNELNLKALERLRQDLTPENRQTLNAFYSARNSPFPFLLLHLIRSGIYRQSLKGTLGLYIATILKRI